MKKYTQKKTFCHRQVLHTLFPEFCPLQDRIQQDVNKTKNNIDLVKISFGSTDRSYSTFIRT